MATYLESMKMQEPDGDEITVGFYRDFEANVFAEGPHGIGQNHKTVVEAARDYASRHGLTITECLGPAPDPFEPLTDAHTKIMAAAAVVSCYGRPNMSKADPFDRAVNRAIDDIRETVDELGELLAQCRLEQVSRLRKELGNNG